MKHTRTLQLEEDVLCVKFSPDHRLLAVSLLDCTVKIFYTDTLKVRHKNTHTYTTIQLPVSHITMNIVLNA